MYVSHTLGAIFPMICKIWDKVKIGPPLRGYFSILIWSLELFSRRSLNFWVNFGVLYCKDEAFSWAMMVYGHHHHDLEDSFTQLNRYQRPLVSSYSVVLIDFKFLHVPHTEKACVYQGNGKRSSARPHRISIQPHMQLWNRFCLNNQCNMKNYKYEKEIGVSPLGPLLIESFSKKIYKKCIT